MQRAGWKAAGGVVALVLSAVIAEGPNPSEASKPRFVSIQSGSGERAVALAGTGGSGPQLIIDDEKLLSVILDAAPVRIILLEQTDDFSRWVTAVGVVTTSDLTEVPIAADPDAPTAVFRATMYTGASETVPPEWESGATVQASWEPDGLVRVCWPPAHDDTALAAYELYVDDQWIGTLPATLRTCRIAGLDPSSHRVDVVARDVFDNSRPAPLSPFLQSRNGVITLDIPTVIGEADYTHDGADLVVDGVEVVMEGQHRFASLVLTNGAVLTHPAGSRAGIDLIVEADLQVAATGRIDVSGKGLLCAGGTYGLTPGSHGGVGAGYGKPADPTYGDYRYPRDPGRGGGNRSALTSRGGGVLRVRAVSIQLDGSIAANGMNGVRREYGSGSGGSILIETEALAGAGTVQADGGSCLSQGGDGGGGGRVAVYASSWGGFETDRVFARGGRGSGTDVGGGAGTVYRFDPAVGRGRLQSIGGGLPAPARRPELALEPAGVQTIEIRDGAAQSLILPGPAAFETVIVSGGGLIQFNQDVTVTDSAELTDGVWIQAGRLHLHDDFPLVGSAQLRTAPGDSPALEVWVEGTLTVPANSVIDVSGCGYPMHPDAAQNRYPSHGGHGWVQYATIAPVPVHGEWSSPVTPGYGWETGDHVYRGGGALGIRAEDVVLDGRLAANADPAAPGSGGSILVETAHLRGSGIIEADGKQGGGGGRVALFVDTIDEAIWAGTEARGGNGAGAGTVYLKRSGDPAGILRLRNGGNGQGALRRSPVSAAGDAFSVVQIERNAGVDLSLSNTGLVDRLAVSNAFLTVRAEPLHVAQDVRAHDGEVELAGACRVAGEVVLEGDSLLTAHPSYTNGVVLVASGPVTIGPGARVDVKGRGGCVTNDLRRIGGSHGGWGGNDGVPGLVPYGDWARPRSQGSAHDLDIRGGGAIWIQTPVLQLDGMVRADGADRQTGVSPGGAGGSVLLEVGTLTGAGTITANGGQGYGNAGGGGGRIAVYHEDASGFDLSRVWCRGGANLGGAGTIFLQGRGDPAGTLIVDNDGRPSDSALRAPLDSSSAAIRELRVQGQATLHLLPGLATGRWDRAALTDGYLTCDGRLEVDDALTIVGSDVETDGLAVSLDLAMLSNAVVRARAAVTNGLHVQVGGVLQVASNCLLHADGAGQGPLPKTTGESGGSYGGAGAPDGGSSAPAYGSRYEPLDPGSGGRNRTGPGPTRGGGSVRVEAGEVRLDGEIRSQGGRAAAYVVGGGSGGGILIDTDRLSGTGALHADGARAHPSREVGHGGGGRIAVYADYAGFDTGNISVEGPDAAEEGTIYLGDRTLLRVLDSDVADGTHPVTDRIHLWFSVPPDLASFTPGDVALTGPSGAVPAVALSRQSPLGYDLTFASLLDEGLYQLQFGPDVRTSLGGGMDQNGNGTPLEGDEDAYRITFEVGSAIPAAPTVDNLAEPPATAYVNTSVVVLYGQKSADTAIVIDGVTVTEPTPSTTWTTTWEAAEGRHLVAVQAVNRYDNRSPTRDIDLVADWTAPTVAAVEPPYDSYLAQGPDQYVVHYAETLSGLDWGWTSTNVLMTRGGSYYVVMDADVVHDEIGSTVTVVVREPWLPGVHYLRGALRDRAGNQRSLMQRFYLDQQPPTPVLEGPTLLDESAAWHGEWPDVRFSVWHSIDNYGVAGSCGWDFGDGSAPLIAGPKVTHTFPTAGEFPVRVTVFDLAGNSTVAEQVLRITPNDPPTPVLVTHPGTIEGGQPVLLDGTASTDDHGIWTYEWFTPGILLDFAGSPVDLREWFVQGDVSQNDRLDLVGLGSWPGSVACGLRGAIPPDGAIEMTVGTDDPGAVALAGLRDAELTTFALDRVVVAAVFDQGAVRIRLADAELPAVASYLAGTPYRLRIEAAGGGARVWLGALDGASSVIYQGAVSWPGGARPVTAVQSGRWWVDDVWMPARYGTGPLLYQAFGPGDAAVRLRVTDHAAQSSEVETVIPRRADVPPRVILEGPRTGPAQVDLTFDASASSDEGGIRSYWWDFGDGAAYAGSAMATHRYAQPGSYRVMVIATDHAGLHGVGELGITVGAATPRIRCVPWKFDGEIELPHETWSGRTNRLKAVLSDVDLPCRVRWNPGDGSPPLVIEVSTAAQARSVEAAHAYTGTPGTPVTAIAQLLSEDGEILAWDAYPLLIREDTLETRINVAIDDGLWYLHRELVLSEVQGQACGHWKRIVPGYSDYAEPAATGAGLLAYELHGHRPTGDAARDPLVDDALLALRYLLLRLKPKYLTDQYHGNPDSDGNRLGLRIDDYPEVYMCGLVLDALVASGAPEWSAPGGGPEVLGRRLADVVQDVVDGIVWGQTDGAYSAGNSWRYSYNTDQDTSASQWPAIGLMAAADVFGATIPEWVRPGLLGWLDRIRRNDMGIYQYIIGQPLPEADSVTAAALIELNFCGIPVSDSRWQLGLNWLEQKWLPRLHGPNADTNSIYYAYTVAKALRTAVPYPLFTFGPSNRDWFWDPEDGLAPWILARQRDDGGWNFDAGATPQQTYIDFFGALGAGFAIATLTPSVFQAAPVAIAEARPNPGAISLPVLFDASASYHSHPSYQIIDYRWDFDASDGIDFVHPDATGPVVTWTYGTPGTNAVTLLVQDNHPARPVPGVARIHVVTSAGPHPPTAEAGGPYLVGVAERLTLNGSGSFDVDEPDGDCITRWQWELDFEHPLDFDDGADQAVAVMSGGFAEPGRRQAALRVEDDSAAVFGLPANLADEDFADVEVYPIVVHDLAGRSKNEKCQLTWTTFGDVAEVWRSQEGPHTGFVPLGTTTNRYATFLDYDVIPGSNYFYRIVVFQHAEPEPIGISPALSVYVRSRYVNVAPEIHSTPPARVMAGETYLYSIEATDRDGDPLSYLPAHGPSGLTVDAAGVVRYQPGPGDIGLHTITIEVSDGLARTVQQWDLLVTPAQNQPPEAVLTAPAAGQVDEEITLDASGSSDPDQDPLRFTWNLGDGTIAEGPLVRHRYAAAGRYHVRLYVHDAHGGLDEADAYVEIERPNRPPVLRLAGGPTFAVRAGQVLRLSAADTEDYDGDPFTFTWTWGDGVVEEGAGSTVDHGYAGPGTYQGSVLVIDARGAQAATYFTVQAAPANQDPTAAFAVLGPLNENAAIGFDAAGSQDPDGDALTYEWDFGDGARGITRSDYTEHTYRDPETMVVRLTVTDDFGGRQETEQSLVISGAPRFLNTPPEWGRVNQPYRYLPICDDPEGDAFTFSLVSASAPMELDPTTGELTWTPFWTATLWCGYVQQAAVHLRVTDARGAARDLRWRIDVDRVNARPEILSLPPTGARPGAPYVYQVRAVDADGDPLTYALTDGPPGMQVLAQPAGRIEWTPPAGTIDAGAQVVVADPAGAVAEQAWRITVSSEGGVPPVAQVATLPGPVYANSVVTLEGGGSFDPEGQPLQYRWTLFEQPLGNAWQALTNLNQTFTFRTQQPGRYGVELVVGDGHLRSEPVEIRFDATVPPVDLQVVQIDVSGLVCDGATLAVTGTIAVAVSNALPHWAGVSWEAAVFADLNTNGLFDADEDAVLAVLPVEAAPPAGTVEYLEGPVDGVLPFRDAQLWVALDPDARLHDNEPADNLAWTPMRVENEPGRADASVGWPRVEPLAGAPGVRLIARVGNAGTEPLPAGAVLSAFLGPWDTADLVGSVVLPDGLEPGRWVDASLAWNSPPPGRHPITFQLEQTVRGANFVDEVPVNNLVEGLLRLNNQPPVAVVGPPLHIYAEDNAWVTLDGRGSYDPEQDPITYRWRTLETPSGANGRLDDPTSPIPTVLVDAPGRFVFELVVNDALSDSAPARLEICGLTRDNAAPRFMSVPPVRGMVGVPYRYEPVIVDDQAGPIDLALVTGPGDMRVVSNRRLVHQPDTAGVCDVVLKATDAEGAFGIQGYRLDIVPYREEPPVILSTPDRMAYVGVEYRYPLDVDDPNANIAGYQLDPVPAGMVLDPPALTIRWTPDDTQLGGHDVGVIVQDAAGLAATQRFTVVVASGPHSPIVEPIPDQVITDGEAFAIIELDAWVHDPDTPVDQLSWSVSGASQFSVDIDAQRIATVSYPIGGVGDEGIREELTFYAEDPDGYVGLSRAWFTVKRYDQAPVAGLPELSPSQTTWLRGLTEPLIGTADDPDPADAVRYRVLLYDLTGREVADLTPDPGPDGWRPGRVREALLGTLDLSRVRNGTYELLLEVNAGELTARQSRVVGIDNGGPIGNFSFSVLDAEVVIRGLSLSLVRTYDSANPTDSDFGFGWTYSVVDMEIEINERRARVRDINGQAFSMRTGGSRDVTLTMPDTGRRATFRYRLEPVNLLTYRAVWDAPAGVHATLEAVGPTELVVLGGGQMYWVAAGPGTRDAAFDFEAFVLTLRDGTQYDIARRGEGVHIMSTNEETGYFVDAYSDAFVSRIRMTSGERLDIERADGELTAVHHYDRDNVRTRSFVFERDDRGRIIALYDPSSLDEEGAPTGPAVMRYAYDLEGRLVEAARLIDRTDPFQPVYTATRYLYDNSRYPYYLTGAQRAGGEPPTQVEYGPDGRVTAIVKSDGSRVEMDHQVADHSSTIYDELGHPTTYVYDDRGNVIAEIDPVGHTVLRGYDADGNVTSVTDPLGHTIRYEYDRFGNQTNIVDALGHTTRFNYDRTGIITRHVDGEGRSSGFELGTQGGLRAVVDPNGNRMQMDLDSRGNAVAQYDQAGRCVGRFSYDRSGNITSETSVSGILTTYQLGEGGERLSATTEWVNPRDPSDRHTLEHTLSYTAGGRLHQVIHPTGAGFTNTYDAFGRLRSIRDEAGQTRTIHYDSQDRVVGMDHGDGTRVCFVYDGKGQPTDETLHDGQGRLVSALHYEYDPAGRLVRQETREGMELGISTNDAGAVYAHVVDPGTCVGVVSNVFDQAGRPIAEQNRFGGWVHHEYDAMGRITATIDPYGGRTEYEYDATGLMTRRVDAESNQWHYTHSPLQQVVSILAPDGSVVSNAYDETGRLVETVDPAGNRMVYGYAEAGWLSQVILPEVINPDTGMDEEPTYQFERDPYGQILAQIDPLGRRTEFAYNPFGHLTSLTRPMGQTQTQQADALGRVTNRVDAAGRRLVKTYGEGSRVLAERHFAAGSATPEREVAYTYNDAGQPVLIDDNGTLTQLEYDSRGALVAIVTTNGTIRYEYDPLSGARTRIRTSGTDVRYTYDRMGRLETVAVHQRAGIVVDPPEATAYVYSPAGRLQRVQRPDGFETRYAYDPLGRIIGLQDVSASGQIMTDYACGYAVNGWQTNLTSVIRGADGSVWTNEVQYGYDRLGRLASERGTVGGSPYAVRFVHDLAGNRVEREVTVEGHVLLTRYGYNANDQLVGETNTLTQIAGVLLGGPQGDRRYYASTVDGWGSHLLRGAGKAIPWGLCVVFFATYLASPDRGSWRRRRWIVATAWTCSCLLLVLPLAQVAYGQEQLQASVAALRHWADAAGNTVVRYRYDAAGSLLERITTGAREETTRYTHDARNRLVEMVQQSGAGDQQQVLTLALGYDFRGLRTERTLTETVGGAQVRQDVRRYLFDPYCLGGFAHVLEERNGAGALLRSYVIGHTVLQESSALTAASRTCLRDPGGSVARWAEEDGSLSGGYAYSGFGVGLFDESSAEVRLGYRGEGYDPTLKAYYLRARHYVPGIGRFLRTDPLAGTHWRPLSLHPYSYAANNPVNDCDPSGLFQYSLTGLMQGLAARSTLTKVALGGIVNYVARYMIWFLVPPSFKARLNEFPYLFVNAIAFGVSASVGVRMVDVSGGAEFVISPFHEALHDPVLPSDGWLFGVSFGGGLSVGGNWTKKGKVRASLTVSVGTLLNCPHSEAYEGPGVSVGLGISDVPTELRDRVVNKITGLGNTGWSGDLAGNIRGALERMNQTRRINEFLDRLDVSVGIDIGASLDYKVSVSKDILSTDPDETGGWLAIGASYSVKVYPEWDVEFLEGALNR